MAEEPNQAATKPQLSGNVLLYRKPEPLNRQEHAKLGMMRGTNQLGFLRDAHFVPVVAGEFPQACLHFPIIFAGESMSPVAVMGLSEGQNVFVRDDGSYEPHVYAPSYVRRYPFVMANDQQSQNVVVCIDRAHEAIQEDADIPFFENGEPSKFTQDAINFLQNYEQHRVATERMVQELKDLDLIEQKTATYTPTNPDGSRGQPADMAKYRGISEQKLWDLSAEKLKELQTKGYLPVIYAHLFSLQNWNHIVNRSIQRGMLMRSENAAGAAAQPN